MVKPGLAQPNHCKEFFFEVSLERLLFLRRDIVLYIRKVKAITEKRVTGAWRGLVLY